MLTAPALLQANRPIGINPMGGYTGPGMQPPLGRPPGIGDPGGAGPVLPGPRPYPGQLPPNQWLGPGQLPPHQWLGPGTKPPQFTLNGGGVMAPSILQRQAGMMSPMAMQGGLTPGPSAPPASGGGSGVDPWDTGSGLRDVTGLAGNGGGPVVQINPGQQSNWNMGGGPFGAGYGFAGSFPSGPGGSSMNWYNGPLGGWTNAGGLASQMGAGALDDGWGASAPVGMGGLGGGVSTNPFRSQALAQGY